MLNLTRRIAMLNLMSIPLVALVPGCGRAASSVDVRGWRGGAEDFFRAPVLVSGEREAILIDGSFNYGAGDAVVEAIRASGTALTAIYVTCNDPDYYFSLTRIAAAFPEARIIAAPETVALIEQKMDDKIAVWGPVLGEFGPQTVSDLVIPERYDGSTLTLESHDLQIITSKTMQDRRYVWVPSLEAVVGGVYAFEGLHVWMADTPTRQDRLNWLAELAALIARNPKIVIAGHAAADVDNGPGSLIFTRDYITAYEEEVARAANSAALVSAMMARFPGLGLEQGLEIGAKVAMGEMAWK